MALPRTSPPSTTRRRPCAPPTTARRDAAERLRAADRVKDDFLATVSHELRTPLTTILGFAPLLRDPPDAATAAGVAERIERNARDMLAMVEQLLDISASRGGRSRGDVRGRGQRRRPRRRRCWRTVPSPTGGSSSSADARECRCAPIRRPCGTSWGTCSRTRRGSRRRTGSIEVATTAAAGAVVVTVADSGPGIAAGAAGAGVRAVLPRPGPAARASAGPVSASPSPAATPSSRVAASGARPGGPGSVFSFTVPQARPRRRSASARACVVVCATRELSREPHADAVDPHRQLRRRPIRATGARCCSGPAPPTRRGSTSWWCPTTS